MDLGSIIALVTGILGVAGLCFTALRFNRDDTTAVVSQQSGVLHDMATLNAELRQTNVDLRTEVAELREQVQRLRHEH